MNDLSLLSLQDILPEGPNQNGLYVIPGDRSFIAVLEDVLVQFLGVESGNRAKSLIGPALWIDSGNYFNPYQMTDMARKRGIDPKMVLRTLRIARPFTAFQFHQMLDKVPEPVLVPVLDKKISEWRMPLVVISDLMGLFYDPEIQEGDLKRAHREFLLKIIKLKRRAIVVALLLNHEVPLERRYLLPRVMELADHIHGKLLPAAPLVLS